MEAFLAFYMVTGLWVYFWVLFAFITILWFGEHEQNFFAGIVLVAFATLMQNSGIITILTDPGALVKWALVFYTVGLAWSFLKWNFFVRDLADGFAERKISFLKFYNKQVIAYNKSDTIHPNRHDQQQDDSLPYRDGGYKTLEALATTPLDEFMRIGFNRWYGYTPLHRDDDADLSHFRPTARQHKSRIITWILWWPTSMFWTVLHDFFLRLGEWFVETFKGVYAQISNKAFDKYNT